MGCQAVEKKIKSLSEFTEETAVLVVSIDGGQGARKKLFDLGIIPGVKIHIMQGTRKHPYILRVGGTKLMVGWGMVEKILVTPAE